MNALGLRTLIQKEVRRFLRVPGQTVLSPLVSTSLYFVVFGYSIRGRAHDLQGVPYMSYIVPGLVFLGIANNAFLNSSSSLFITKIQGTLVDLLVAPLGALEIVFGFVAGAMARGLGVGVLTWLVSLFFVQAEIEHPLLTAGALLASAYVFAVLGFLAALWAEKFEQINLFPSFVMLPLTFLGGVFYSVRDLPSPWSTLSLANPMVYLVDSLRYAMLGVSTFSPWVGLAMILGLAVFSTLLALHLVRSGYKLKG